MKEYLVVYEEGPTSWGAYVPDLPGCFAVGKTRGETKRLIQEAIEEHLDVLKSEGLPVPKSTHVAEKVTVPA